MLIAALSSLMFIVFCAALGAGTLRAFRQQGRTPEMYVAVSFLATSVGLSCQFATITPDFPDGALRIAASVLSVAMFVSGAAVLRFIALAFRAGSPTGEFVAHTGIFAAVVLAGYTLVVTVSTPLASLRSFDGAGTSGTLFLCLTLSWLAVEAISHWVKLKRQRALGLSDAVLVNRMMLYALGSVLSVLGIASTLVPVVVWGIDPTQDPVVRVVSSVLGAPIGIIYYLALLPPARYQRWLAAGAQS